MTSHLATVEKVLEFIKHPNADRLNLITINGWQCVTAEHYNVGDFVVYIQIDTTVPRQPWSEFLFKNEPETKDRTRIKSIRLRGEISQGLVLPMHLFSSDIPLEEGYDVTDIIQVGKYEKPMPSCQEAKGNFPTHLVSKTDEPRIQSNIKILHHLEDANPEIYITKKMDGTSGTFIKHEGELIVCSRNLMLKETPNNYWKMVEKYNLRTTLKEGEVIQCEICGPGIQQNPSGETELGMYAFNHALTHKKIYTGYEGVLQSSLDTGVPMVEVLFKGSWKDFISILPENNIEGTKGILKKLLDYADSIRYKNGKQCEGVVVRTVNEFEIPHFGRLSFKIISNEYDIKNG